ncbi:MAG TPA: LamG domain-containing protein [Candidatus Pacearchaeota archaeon]|nr:hypothetical protein BMS3Abin17_00088 [archaeon BMS3Abin17]HDK41828.1 LamG domain-containing protein [Candidatus Pacearchaeota archaeon]HDZ60164.1 LamG domain-containing protein [Candidatus Pacearchaeota archaeon]
MKKLLLITLFCMILLVGSVSAITWDNTGYFKLDETSGTDVAESVSGINNGVVENSSGIWKSGIINNAINLSGNDDIVLGDHYKGSSYTWNLWVNASTVSVDYMSIMDYGGRTGGDYLNETHIRILGSKITVLYDKGNHIQTSFGSSSSIIANTWTMITLVVNSSGSHIYFNGTYENSTNVIFDTNGFTKSLYLGNATDGAGDRNFKGRLDEVSLWDRSLSSSEITELYNEGAGLAYVIGVLTLTINLTTPNNTQTLDSYYILNATHTTTIPANLTNTTLTVWNNNGQQIWSNFTIITGVTNTTSLTSSNLSTGIYLWNYNTCTENATAYLCTWAPTNYSLNISAFSEDAITYNSTSVETASETFIQQITTNGSIPTDQKFIYNNTVYTATLTSIAGNIYNLSSTINIPINNVTNNFWFNFTLGSELSTTSNSQDVSLLSFGICNATLTIPYINFTFKDEADLNTINASIPTSTFVYWIGTGALNKSLTYINSTSNQQYKFCASPPDKTLNVDIYMQYKNGTTYPQRTYDPTPLSFTNSTTEKVLYLLSTADGLYVTFQVIDSAQQAISGVSVNATRTISGSTVVIGDGTTDAAGAVTFWMNPDFTHLLSFVKSGYDFYSISLTPTQSSYTITLGSAITTITDYLQGVSFIMSPSANFLDNNTLYNFSYGLTSSYWSVQKFGFYLYYSNGSLIGSQHASTNGGTLSILNVNTFNESSIYLTHYYTVNSTNTTYNPVVWIIQSTEGRQFSIWHFFTDLTLYTNSGDFFGLDDFGRTLLSFVIIVMVVGGLSSRYGIRSEAAIMGILFGLVFLLDVQLGMIPQISVGNLTAIPNFVTYLTFIILVAIIIREEKR